MFRCLYLAVILGFGIYCGCVVAAGAEKIDRQNMTYEYARNKVGLLRYCRRQDLVNQFAAAKAAQDIEVGLADFDFGDRFIKERGDKAEKMGEAGFWDMDGQLDLAKVAALFGISPAELCSEVAGVTGPARQPAVAVQVRPAAPVAKTPAASAPAVKAPRRSQAQKSPPPKSPRKSQTRLKQSPPEEQARNPPARNAKPPVPATERPSPDPAYLSPSEVNKWLHDRHARPWAR